MEAAGPPDMPEIMPMRWRSIAAAIAAISVVGTAIGLGVPLLSVLLESRGYSASMIGLNTAIGGVASIAAAPLAIPIAARLGVAHTMLIMLVVGAASFTGFYLFADFWVWFGLRASLNFAITILFILSEFWITSSAPEERRGLILGLYATCLSLGFAFGPWLFAVLGSDGFAPFAAVLILIGAATLPMLAARGESPDIVTSERTDLSFWRFIFLVPTATAAVLVFGAVETGGFALFPVYGVRIGMTEADAALILTMIGLGNVFLQIPLGMLSDRMADRRWLLVACAVVGLAGMVILPFIHTSWYLSAAMFFVWGGVVAGLYTVGLAHLGSRLRGRDLASANAAFVLCYGIGMLAGPQAIGIAMDAVGTEGFAHALAAFFALYIVLVLARVRTAA